MRIARFWSNQVHARITRFCAAPSSRFAVSSVMGVPSNSCPSYLMGSEMVFVLSNS